MSTPIIGGLSLFLFGLFFSPLFDELNVIVNFTISVILVVIVTIIGTVGTVGRTVGTVGTKLSHLSLSLSFSLTSYIDIIPKILEKSIVYKCFFLKIFFVAKIMPKLYLPFWQSRADYRHNLLYIKHLEHGGFFCFCLCCGKNHRKPPVVQTQQAPPI